MARPLRQLSLLCLAGAAVRTTGISIALPADNDRSLLRHDPEVFRSPWALPQLLPSSHPGGERWTDVTVHGGEGGEEPLLMSLLYPSSWERRFSGVDASAFCRQWWWVSYVAATLYLVGLRWGTSVMTTRPAFEFKALLVIWNLLLAVYSAMGAMRTVPHLLLLLRNFGFEYTICRAAVASYSNGAAGFWVCLFIYSKYFELIDTVLLVLRKKQVPFLHWYHHFTVLLYCWNAYVWEMPTGIYFAAMNYSVHAIMYFYYFLAAVCSRPPKWAKMVTVLQLTQMVIGVTVTLLHIRLLLQAGSGNCDGHLPNLAAAAGMYASYFYLFAAFFAKRFNKKQDPAAKAPKGALPKLD